MCKIISNLGHVKFVKFTIGKESKQFPPIKWMGVLFIYRGNINSKGIYMIDDDNVIRIVNPASSEITVTCKNKIITVTNSIGTVQHCLLIYF